MNEKRTSIFENGLIWFGAGVSLAEILTGTYFAPLGFGKGVLAIIIGHIIGCMMLFLAGVIGGKTRRSAMETVKMSFGEKGGIFFSFLNVLQLVGWTAIMIYDGALAANGVLHTGRWVWCLVIGVLIILWIVIGITNLGKINTVAMAALFILTLVLSRVIFGDGSVAGAGGDAMTFGAAVELSVAMPLSWLPLISDYTREAKEPVKATAVSAVVYGVVSCWMYVIGMNAAIYTGESDIANIMVKSRTWNSRTSDHCIFYRYDNFPGCLLSRNFVRVSIFKNQWEICSNCCNCDRNDRSDCLSDGQHYRFPVPDRFCIRADDRNPDCGFLHSEEKGQPGSISGCHEWCNLGDRFYTLSYFDECGYSAWKYTSGYGHHHRDLYSCKKMYKDKKIALKENGNTVLTFPFSFDRTCSDLQKRGGKMNADAWKRGKSL